MAACTATRPTSIPRRGQWSGGIYEEAQRGWFYTGEMNPPGKALYKFGEWNHYRIEAIGPRLRVWINGSPAADVIDDGHKTGFFGLQVHSINKPEEAGRTTTWKNLRRADEEPQAHAAAWASSSATTCLTISMPRRRRRAGGCCGMARPRRAGAAPNAEASRRRAGRSRTASSPCGQGRRRRHHDRRGIRRLRAADGVQGVAPAPTAASSIY